MHFGEIELHDNNYVNVRHFLNENRLMIRN
jgi:hypothetical protein